MLVNKNEEQEYEKQYLSEAFEVELGRVVDEANELLHEARAQAGPDSEKMDSTDSSFVDSSVYSAFQLRIW